MSPLLPRITALALALALTATAHAQEEEDGEELGVTTTFEPADDPEHRRRARRAL